MGTTLVLGVLAGAFIGFGSFLALSVGGACPGLASANPGLQKMVLVRAGALSCATSSCAERHHHIMLFLMPQSVQWSSDRGLEIRSR